MDPEEKQELKKNDLEGFLYYRLPHYLKQYGAYILLVLALAFLAFQLWRRQEAKVDAHSSEASMRLTEAKNAVSRLFERSLTASTENPVKLYEEIQNDFKDVKPVAADAHLALGNFYNTLLLTNRKEIVPGTAITKEESIGKAREQYSAVVSEFAEYPTRVAAAKLGLAALLETEGAMLIELKKEADGIKKWDESKKMYEEISSDTGPWAGSVYASEAKKKLKIQDMLKGKVQTAADPIEKLNTPIGPMPIGGTNIPMVPIMTPPTNILPKDPPPSVLGGLLTPSPDKPATTMQGIGGELIPATTQPK